MRWVSLVCVCLAGLAGPGCRNGAADPRNPRAPVAVQETAVRFQTSAGEAPGKLFLPETASVQKPAAGLVLVHEDHGLTSWEIEQARRLAGNGYAVLAVDLYRGRQVGDVMEAHIIGRGLPEDRVLAELKGAVDFLAGQAVVRPDRLGIIGWDIGAGYALDAARTDSRIAICISCYGRVTTDSSLLAPLQASVLAIFAGKDEGIPPETVREFRSAMAKAGKPLKLAMFPGSRHGFMNPASPEAGGGDSPEATRAAWEEIDTFLREGWKKP